MRSLSLMLLLSGLLATPAAGQENGGSDVPPLLAPGDSVRITVWRNPELSGEYLVAPDNTVLHPLYRGVVVGGVPFDVAQENLRVFLKHFDEDPQFVFEPLFQVAVEGEVTRAGLFALAPGISVAEAVVRAGGPTPFARKDRVRVLRRQADGSQSEFVLDLNQAAATEHHIRSGDRIIVDRKKALFRDVILPVLTVVGSVASVIVFIERNK